MARAPRKPTRSVPLASGAPRAKPRVDKEARKANYLRAAARVFLAKGAKASMQEVADEAGAPKPVFYRIFPSKAELIDAIFQHCHDVILLTQQGEWDGYGWAMRVIYLAAKPDREIFLVALKTFRGDPEWDHWRERLLDLIHNQAVGFFRPSEGAPAGGEKRALRAAKTLNVSTFETLVAWLEDRDGLSDEQRFLWYGRIIREWRFATREAFELDPPGDPPEAQGPRNRR